MSYRTARNKRARPVVSASCNPFSQQHLEQLLYRFPDGHSWQHHFSRLANRAFRGLIVGPRGTGKTTIMRELHGHLGRISVVGASPLVHPCIAEAKITKRPVPISQPTQNFLIAEQSDALHSLLLNIPRRATTMAGRAEAGMSAYQQRCWLRQQLADLNPSTVLLIDGMERLGWGTRMMLVRHWARPGRCAGVVISTHRSSTGLGLPVWLTTSTSPAQLKSLLLELGVTEESLHRLAEDYYCRHAGNVREVFRALYDHVACGRVTH